MPEVDGPMTSHAAVQPGDDAATEFDGSPCGRKRRWSAAGSVVTTQYFNIASEEEGVEPPLEEDQPSKATLAGRQQMSRRCQPRIGIR